MKFLIESVWPGGAIILLVPLWTEIMRDIREEVGHEIYYIIEKEIKTHISDRRNQTLFLGHLMDARDRLLSVNKSTRKQALEHLIKKFQDEGWPDP